MSVPVPVFETAGGMKMPRLGLGTGRIGNTADLDNYGDVVAHALRTGYRLIDTAWKYGTEQGVGEGMRHSGVPREDVFLVTKVSHEYLRAGDVARMVDESLAHLKVDYVDLLMVHWPSPDRVPLAETMHALAKAKREGKARHLGVANFNIAMLDEAIRLCPETIDCLQAEYHPYLDQTKVLAHLRKLGLPMMAYCPLGRGKLLDDLVVTAIARAHGKTNAQVLLRWHLQQPNVVPIPRSTNPARQIENFSVFDFTLSAAEMQRLHALARPDGRIANPAGRSPVWD
jgi:diketogulonate reductase-like aldo/keto reductase